MHRDDVQYIDQAREIIIPEIGKNAIVPILFSGIRPSEHAFLRGAQGSCACELSGVKQSKPAIEVLRRKTQALPHLV